MMFPKLQEILLHDSPLTGPPKRFAESGKREDQPHHPDEQEGQRQLRHLEVVAWFELESRV